MNKRRQRLKYIGIDFLTASVSWLLFNLLRYSEVASLNFETLTDFLLYVQVMKGQIMVPLFWLILYFFSGYYNKLFGKSRLGELFSTFVTIAIGSVMIFFIVILNELPPTFQTFYKFFFSLFGIQFALTYTGRLLITGHAIRKSRSHEWVENVLIVGTGEEAADIRQYLERSGYQIVGFVGDNLETWQFWLYVGMMVVTVLNKVLVFILAQIYHGKGNMVHTYFQKIFAAGCYVFIFFWAFLRTIPVWSISSLLAINIYATIDECIYCIRTAEYNVDFKGHGLEKYKKRGVQHEKIKG
jgi:hypothetical protein